MIFRGSGSVLLRNPNFFNFFRGGPGSAHVETEMLVHGLFNKTASINGMTAQVGKEGDPNKYLHPLNFLYATIQPYLTKRDIFVPGHT